MKFADKIKQLIRKVSPNLWVFIKGNKFIFSTASYLNKVGYIESIRKDRPCEADGSPLPWMNYGVIDLLKSRLSKQHSLFEYGSGSSTLFWASYVGRLVAVEHDEQWYEKVASELPENAKLIFRSDKDPISYVQSVAELDDQYDVIIVDGIERTECLKAAPQNLTSSGVIIFDDSDRKRWSDGVTHLADKGFKQLRISGLKPTGFGIDETSIFYRDRNCLGI